MDFKEYKEQVEKLKKEYDSKKNELDLRFAIDKCPYKIGDFVEDHSGILKIESIHLWYDYLSNIPTLYFRGTEYTKKGEIKKKQDKSRQVFQSNVKKIIEF